MWGEGTMTPESQTCKVSSLDQRILLHFKLDRIGCFQNNRQEITMGVRFNLLILYWRQLRYLVGACPGYTPNE